MEKLAPVNMASVQGFSLAVFGFESYPLSVKTSLPRTVQNVFTMARPMAVPW